MIPAYNQLRLSSADFSIGNPILKLNEIGVESDSNRTKIGDGQVAWNDLTYIDSPYTYGIAAGTDTYTVSIGKPKHIAILDGMPFRVKFPNANTGAATLNINSLGAKSIKKGVSTNIVAGDILTGQIIYLQFDGTNFQIVGGFGNGISSGITGGGTLNYISKWTPNGTTLGDSIIQDDGTNIGIANTYVANNRVYIKGEDATSGKYALHTVDVSSADTFWVNNAGQVNAADSFWLAGNKLIHRPVATTNLAFGVNTGTAITSGVYNFFAGLQAGQITTTGYWNTFVGQLSGAFNVGGYDNAFYGLESGYTNSSGYRNTFIGSGAGYFHTTGNRNTFLGWHSGYNVVGAANRNTLLGTEAGIDITSGTDNVCIGEKSGILNNGIGCFFFGYSGSDQTVPGVKTHNYSIALGFQSSISASQQMVIGGSFTASAITEIIVGRPNTDSTVGTVDGLGATIRAADGYSSVAANKAGGDLYLAGGKMVGTGGATPKGRVIIATYDNDGGNTSPLTNTLIDRLFVLGGQAATQMGIGGSPAASTILDLQSTVGALLLPRMTTAQKNALTAVDGMVIYDLTLNAFQFRENGAWVSGSGLV